MSSRSSRLVAALLAISPLACASAPHAVTQRTPTPNSFAARLHGALRSTPGNLFYSPASVKLAMTMVREGARGSSAVALDRVLGASAGREARTMLATLHGDGVDGAPELSLADRLFVNAEVRLEPAFARTLSEDYHAPAEPLDFAKEPWVPINRWAEDATRGHIRELVPRGKPNSGSTLVLVNAAYLKAKWAHPFEAQATRPEPFLIAGTGRQPVPMMHGVLNHRMGHFAGARVLDLPYQSSQNGPRLSMLLVVPEGEDGLAAVEKAYVDNGIEPFVAAADAQRGRISLSMPAFELSRSVELSKVLAAVGLDVLFRGDADLSGMSPSAERIDEVFHQAWARVDESGTEAAAATAVIVMRSPAREPPPLQFAVDRSFLFFVRDDVSGAVLFAGRVIDPRK